MFVSANRWVLVSICLLNLVSLKANDANFDPCLNISDTIVASDNLHPSTLAYTKFVERILPIAMEKLQP